MIMRGGCDCVWTHVYGRVGDPGGTCDSSVPLYLTKNWEK